MSNYFETNQMQETNNEDSNLATTVEELMELIEQEKLGEKILDDQCQELINNNDCELFLNVRNLSLSEYCSLSDSRMKIPVIKESNEAISNILLDASTTPVILTNDINDDGHFYNTTTHLLLLSSQMLLPYSNDAKFHYLWKNRSGEKYVDGVMISIYNEQKNAGVICHIPSINNGKKFYGYFVRVKEYNSVPVFVDVCNLKQNVLFPQILKSSIKLKPPTSLVTSKELILCKNVSKRLYSKLYEGCSFKTLNTYIYDMINETIDHKYVYKMMVLSRDLNVAD